MQINAIQANLVYVFHNLFQTKQNSKNNAVNFEQSIEDWMNVEEAIIITRSS
jgi:hypothetical protein